MRVHQWRLVVANGTATSWYEVSSSKFEEMMCNGFFGKCETVGCTYEGRILHITSMEHV